MLDRFYVLINAFLIICSLLCGNLKAVAKIKGRAAPVKVKENKKRGGLSKRAMSILRRWARQRWALERQARRHDRRKKKLARKKSRETARGAVPDMSNGTMGPSLGSSKYILELMRKYKELFKGITPEDLKAYLKSTKLAEKGAEPGPAKKSIHKIPIVINGMVQAYINYFLGPAKITLRYWMGRSQRYMPVIKRVLRKLGLPRELGWLPGMESGFRPRAVSPLGAVGLWQFVARTAGNSGLRVNYWIDERLDATRATWAAGRHLKYLYNIFQDWHLAIAAYNTGHSIIQFGIKKYNTRDFWKLCKTGLFKQETRHYLPKFLAMIHVISKAGKYGLTPLKPLAPLGATRVQVPPTDLRVAALAAGVPLSTIQRYNPELRRWCTPPRMKYTLKLPWGSKKRFWRHFRKLKSYQRIHFIQHRVRFGETLEEIAWGYGTKASIVSRMNRVMPGGWLKPGKLLDIPIPARKGDPKPKLRKRPCTACTVKIFSTVDGLKGLKTLYYKVIASDSLWRIAHFFKVKIKDLLAWNGLPEHGALQPGQLLRIFVKPDFDTTKAILYDPDMVQVVLLNPKNRKGIKRRAAFIDRARRTAKVYYRVKAGDSLWAIAMRLGIPVKEIMQQNGVRKARALQIGSVITLHVIPNFYSSLVMPENPDDKKNYRGNGKRRRWLLSRHQVCAGDTLSSIAQKYNMKVTTLKRLNRLKGHGFLRIGKKLKVKKWL